MEKRIQETAQLQEKVIHPLLYTQIIKPSLKNIKTTHKYHPKKVRNQNGNDDI